MKASKQKEKPMEKKNYMIIVFAPQAIPVRGPAWGGSSGTSCRIKDIKNRRQTSIQTVVVVNHPLPQSAPCQLSIVKIAKYTSVIPVCLKENWRLCTFNLQLFDGRTVIVKMV